MIRLINLSKSLVVSAAKTSSRKLFVSERKDLFELLLFFFFIVENADEVKGIEFTVTTLNCAHDQGNNTAPEHRHKFSSMRKTGALSKMVRSKISKSFHHSSNPAGKSDKTSTQSNDADKLKESEPMGKIKGSSGTKATTPTTAVPTDKNKKRSKLCQLL